MTELSNPTSGWSLIGDQPRPSEDLLNFTRYIQPIVQQVQNPRTQTPLTIGVFGRWGTGKTTLMRMIQDVLKEGSDICVEFIPWIYKTEENLIIPLLHTLNEALLQKRSERVRAAALRVATVTAQVATSLAMKTLSVGQVDLKDIDDAIQHYNQKHGEGINAIARLRRELQDIVDEATNKGKNGRLVLYIDDLDRCLPEQIISLLEAIKLFLDLKHTVIFLAVDREIVRQGIQVYFRDFKFTPDLYDDLAADYLDKMIQVPVYLHPMSEEQVGAYAERLMESTGSGLSDELRGLMKTCLLPNPRKIKRVLNIYTLMAQLVDCDPVLRKKIDKACLAKMVLIQQQWRVLYKESSRHTSLLTRLEWEFRQAKGLPNFRWTARSDDESTKLIDAAKNFTANAPQQLIHLFASGVEIASFEELDLKPYFHLLG